MSEDRVRGRFVWHELMTSDVPAAISFYSKVVGWTTQQWDMDSNYTMWVGADGPVGGVMTLPPEAKAMGAPPHWMTYVGAMDVDAMAQQAESLGARVLRTPDDVPNGGRFAILQDPQGAVFSIYRPAPNAPAPSDGPVSRGDFSWHELITTDLEAGFAFYRELFGWDEMERMHMGPEMGDYLIFGYGGSQRGGMYRKPASMPAPPHWLPYALIRDARGAAEAISANGGMVLNGPMEVPGGDWITMGLDPQGVAFAVHSKAADTRAADAARAASAKPAAAPKPAAKAAAPAKKAAKPRKAAKKAAKPRKAAKKAAKKKPAKKAKKKAARRKPARKKVAKKAARRKPAKRKAAKKAARRPARRKAGRKAARKTARRPAKRKAAKKPARRARPRKRK